MNEEMFNELLQSVKEIDSFHKKEMTSRNVTKLEIQEPQVKSIRMKIGLTQLKFAALLGVSKRTLENWEQGRRQPTGPAKALLKMVEADPENALRTLHF